MSKLKFIDLFAGLGGFHLALDSLADKIRGVEFECVFASELKEDLRKLYQQNFPNTRIEGDITQIDPKDIPAHDVLCAGFPCQPFSQAGKRMGFDDTNKRGNLFYSIYNILNYHRPQYIILENVANLKGHDQGRTWKTIETMLKDLRYDIRADILSPHSFEISQHRRRIFIVGRNRDYGNLDYFKFPVGRAKDKCNINGVIDLSDTNFVPLRQETRQQLAIWQEFLNNIVAAEEKIPQFPIWAMEFGADYNYKIPPCHQSFEDLHGKHGKLGQVVTGFTKEECIAQLPIYVQGEHDEFPKWKIRYIEQNREFYARHKSWLDEWLLKVRDYENSHLKLEWNCGDVEATMEDKIIQFRASGIRVKLPTFAPALNLVGTQIPIFPWVKLPEGTVKEGQPDRGRYMTIKEAAAIQGMQKLFESCYSKEFPLTVNRIYEALGNAINVTLVRHIAKNLFTNEK